jgi:ring-1,2-phenylacetyl-CoA epoxidase subunit PaaC
VIALRAGDNGLVLGQQLVALIGHAPVLEEELGLANVALDLLGQARMWLSYAGEADGRSEDDLAFFRSTADFRNALLVERPNGSFAETIVRQFLFDAWHVRALAAWSASSDARVAEIAQKARREVEYHLKRSSDWVVRLGDGTAESHTRMQAALDELWPYTHDLFVDGDVERDSEHLSYLLAEMQSLRRAVPGERW